MNLISATVKAVSFLTLAIVAAVLTTSSASIEILFNSLMLLLPLKLIVSICCASTALCTASSGSRSRGAASSVACKNFSANSPRNTFAYLPCLKFALAGPLGVAPPCNLHRLLPFNGAFLHVPPPRVFAPHAFMELPQLVSFIGLRIRVPFPLCLCACRDLFKQSDLYRVMPGEVVCKFLDHAS